VDVLDYELGDDQEGLYVTFAGATASREWLTLLLQDLLVGRRFHIPEQFASYAKLLL
jgi:hypothetical protein